MRDFDDVEVIPCMTLQLECYSDNLSPAQLKAFEKAEKEHNEIRSKLDDIVRDSENVFSGDIFKAYHISGDAPSTLEKIARPIAELKKEVKKSQAQQLKQKVDVPKLSPSNISRSRSDIKKRSYTELDAEDYVDDDYMPLSKKLAKIKEKNKAIKKELSPPPPSTPPAKSTGRKNTSKAIISTAAPSTPIIAPNVRPSENTAVGGLSIGNDAKKPKEQASSVVDLTSEDGSGKAAADSREISFNKIQGKTFPSLVVVARPCLKAKDNLPSDRAALDAKVKGVLMHTATKFTEWLIQQGLVRSEQACPNHAATQSKLGMYSDVTKFPYSGGYVWISPCCQQRFVSVFNGSLFEGASQPPSVILKLIYHWACQTNVQNVVQWVKVDNLFVKALFTWLRGICTIALQKHMTLFGGPGKKIEVGVISLGTTTQDGQQRQVKVEVLGILDPEAKLVRLRAVEPLNDGERNYKKRFSKILEPLTRWVHKDSVILTDLTVDKGTLNSMGYKSVIQTSSPNDAQGRNSNSHIMDYLRRIVPRMFQNTLSLLSRQIIQQFLDELVWRECYGVTPGQAFDNVVQHLAEQTKIEDPENLIARLNRVAANPFKQWDFGVDEVIPSSSGAGAKKKRKPNVREPSPVPIIQAESRKKATSAKVPEKKLAASKVTIKKEEMTVRKTELSPELKKVDNILLEKYYYGTFEDPHDHPTGFENFMAQCCECNSIFTKNTDLMDHMKQHVSPGDDENTSQCRYCLENWANDSALQKHIQLTHPLKTKNAISSTFNCIICETRYSTIPMLGSHMVKTHVPLEMPYKCSLCYFRSSSHHKVIDHFYERHHDTSTLQCPFCLKGVSVFSNGKYLLENAKLFLQHLQKHASKTNDHKCPRCNLTFLHGGLMKAHQIYNHTNNSTIKSQITPLTNEMSKIMRPKKTPQTFSVKDIHYKVLEKLNDVTLEIQTGMYCLECETNLDDEKHYLGQLQCLKCPYQTCCLPSMLDHTASCTGTYATENSTLSQLDGEMHCLCGFSSSDGNALARHLAMCDRRSAYPSLESVHENTVKRNMLDMLGLVPRADQPDEIDLKLPDNILDEDQQSSSLNDTGNVSDAVDMNESGNLVDMERSGGNANDSYKPLEEPFTPYTPSQFDFIHNI